MVQSALVTLEDTIVRSWLSDQQQNLSPETGSPVCYYRTWFWVHLLNRTSLTEYYRTCRHVKLQKHGAKKTFMKFEQYHTIELPKKFTYYYYITPYYKARS